MSTISNNREYTSLLTENEIRERQDCISIGKGLALTGVALFILAVGMTFTQYYGHSLHNPVFLTPGLGVATLIASPFIGGGLKLIISNKRILKNAAKNQLVINE